MLELHTVTLEGMHFKKQGKGGMYLAPLPFTPEEGAHSPSWDAELLTLSYICPDLSEPQDENGNYPDKEVVELITEGQINDAITYIETPKPPVVPERVTSIQFEFVCIEQGFDVDALLAALPDGTVEEQQTKAKAQSEWKRANHIYRNHGLVTAMAATIPLTSEEVDTLFIYANTIRTV